jgi:uncharacterized Tic20 family protein
MSADQTPARHESALTPDERTWAMIAHLSALVGMIVPFGNVIAPFLVWRVRRDQSAFVGEHAKEALNFNISVLIAVFACYVLTWLLIGLLLLAVVVVLWLALIIRAAIRASEGLSYRYPLTLRLVA